MPNNTTLDIKSLWIIIIVLAGLLVAMTIFFVVYLCVKKHQKKHNSENSKQDKAHEEHIPVTVGKVHEQGDRSNQQDCFAVSPQELFFSNGMLAVVADGMGGLSDGDKISQTVVASMFENFLLYEGTKEELLLYLTEIANRNVSILQGASEVGKSGSTLVAGFIYEGRFYYLSIGDSRICLFRNGQLIQLNREHIYKNDLYIDAVNGRASLQGVASNPQKSGLVSYLGMGLLKYVDIPAAPITIKPGDTFVLMSDGVYNALTEEELASALSLNAETAADKIRSMISGKAYKNQDNYTAIILRYDI